ncbi:hypothetical protein K435DRAFT_369326 [Dendrothele bispora CBS 962.96]|uniref:AB hydrolase-1 domain-containing protein n=1 Tax=Dendrothele bispora (strain CBS 962.96) TaxID=1314807 RepID=A0A4S8LD52_DENBC|nr:hypothetical protein K435DRAFT_369326 [Dendrothele bispora CBS 962.96]
MLGQTFPEYVFILFSIAFIRSIAPACLFYVLACIHTRRLFLSIWTSIYLGLEVIFLLFYLVRRRRLQQEALHKPPPLTKSQRQKLFQRCAEHIISISSPSEDVTRNLDLYKNSNGNNSNSNYPLGWFPSTLQAPSPNRLPKKGNVIEWLLWALFSISPEQAHRLEKEGARREGEGGDLREEIEDYIEKIETLLGTKFEEGRDSTMSSIRLTLDPVKMVHRPLLWYFTVFLVDMYTALRLFRLGFRHYAPRTQTRSWFRVFPPRPFTWVFSKPAATEQFSYWYRPASTSTSTSSSQPRNLGSKSESSGAEAITKDPIVFIHGIGVGLHPYTPFLTSLIRSPSSSSSAPSILLIELLPISSRITSFPSIATPSLTSDTSKPNTNTPQHPATTPLTAANVSLDAFYTTLSSLGLQNAVLATHSYGTVLGAWILREQRARQTLELRLKREKGEELGPGKAEEDDGERRHAVTRHNERKTPTITSHVFIDPIPILLHLPDVAYNFLYRPPGRRRWWNWNWNANEWQLWYFASRDPDVAYELHRGFWWTENVLWKEDLVGGGGQSSGKESDNDERSQGEEPRAPRIAVILSEKDQIVPSERVWEYLTSTTSIGTTSECVAVGVKEPNPSTRSKESLSISKGSTNNGNRRWISDCGHLEVLWFDGLDHAMVFDDREGMGEIQKVLEGFCGVKESSGCRVYEKCEI